MTYLLKGAAVALALSLSVQAQAADEEIEVYTYHQAAPGELDLDVHMNYVANGESGGEFEGGEATTRRLRITPEFSLGLGHGFEAGFYAPLLTVANEGVLRAHGVIGRLKWIAPRQKSTGVFWGGNVEIGRVDGQIDENPWHGEIKGIVGWNNARWLVSANPTVGFKLSGEVSAPAVFAINSKLSYKLTPKLAVGVESYNGTGVLNDGVHFRTAEQSSFLVIDAPVRHWFVHGGVGLGYGGNRDHAIFVLSLGVPLPQIKQ